MFTIYRVWTGNRLCICVCEEKNWQANAFVPKCGVTPKFELNSGVHVQKTNYIESIKSRYSYDQ